MVVCYERVNALRAAEPIGGGGGGEGERGRRQWRWRVMDIMRDTGARGGGGGIVKGQGRPVCFGK